MSEARSRRAGGAAWSDPTSVGVVSLIIDPMANFSGAMGGSRKEPRFSDLRSGMGWIGGGAGERPPYSFTRRLSSTPTLVPRFGLALWDSEQKRV